MSILIKGAKPPKNCWECLGNDLCIAIAKMGGACPFTERIIGRNKFDAHSGIHPDCPLVEVPEPHGRLIDADELKTKHHWTDDYYETEYVEMEDIDNAPTVIEAEEQEHDCGKSEEEKE